MLLGAPWQAWVTAAVLLGAVFAMVRDWGEPAKLMLLAVGLLTVGGLVTPARAFGGMASPAVLVVGAFMAMATAFERTPALRWLGARALSAGLLPVAAISSVVPNTPVVAVLIPAVRRWAKDRGTSPARLLMPLSFASILGGACTLVGTSSTLVVHGMLLDAGDPGLGVFELLVVAGPAALVGVAYCTLAAPALLPDRADPVSQVGDNPREYVAGLRVVAGGRHDGARVESLRHLQGLFVVGVEREGTLRSPVAPSHELRGGDVLVFAGQLDGIASVAAEGDLTGIEEGEDDATLAGAQLVEAVISPSSPLIGRNIREAGFRSRYDAAVLAVHRHGARIGGRIGDITVHPGDTLVLATGEEFLDRWRHSLDFYLATAAGRLDPGAQPPPAGRDWIPALTLVAVVAVAALELLPLLRAAVAGVLALLVSGHLRGAVLWRGLRLPTLVLIGASIGLGNAFVDSGAGDLLGRALSGAVAGASPAATLVAILVATAALTELIHKAAVAALMFPIATALAAAANLPLHAAACAVALGAAWSFLTPAGYQTNAMVASAAPYRASEFLRFGLPLKLLTLAIAAALLPWSTGVSG